AACLAILACNGDRLLIQVDDQIVDILDGKPGDGKTILSRWQGELKHPDRLRPSEARPLLRVHSQCDSLAGAGVRPDATLRNDRVPGEIPQQHDSSRRGLQNTGRVPSAKGAAPYRGVYRPHTCRLRPRTDGWVRCARSHQSNRSSGPSFALRSASTSWLKQYRRATARISYRPRT